jgi:hypothetical protein
MTTPLHYESFTTTAAARLVMRSEGTPCLDGKGGVHHWSWAEDECEAVFQPPDRWDWLNRLSSLEQQGYAGLCAYAGIAGDFWLDEATEENFERYVTSGGVLRLAQWYGEAP